MLKRNILSTNKMKRVLLGLLVLAASSSAFAAISQSDFNKNIEINSRYSVVNAMRKISTFSEDVHIVQGSLKIDADKVEVIATNGKGNEVFIATGKPATYQQTLENGSVISAKANEIRYQIVDRTLTLTGTAELQQNSSKVQSDLIVFNIDKQELVAQGDSDTNNRVKTIFNPSDFNGIDTEKLKGNN